MRYLLYPIRINKNYEPQNFCILCDIYYVVKNIYTYKDLLTLKKIFGAKTDYSLKGKLCNKIHGPKQNVKEATKKCLSLRMTIHQKTNIEYTLNVGKKNLSDTKNDKK